METTTKTCPKCYSDNFAERNYEPVTVNGWYGDVRYGWGRVGGVQTVQETGYRCGDCGHVVAINPGFDRS